MTERAPGKVNLSLFVGAPRADGLTEDEVVCPGVEGENLVAQALREYRSACGSERPPARVRIDKRIPVAGGMGGGSSDAARALAQIADGWPSPCATEVARRLGSDVPAFLEPRGALVTGGGEDVSPLPGRAGWAFVVVALDARLSAGEVYAEADRLGLARDAGDLAARRDEVEAAVAAGPLPLDLMHNDLEVAARALCPAIDRVLEAVGEVTERAFVTGSGPTVVGVCADEPATHDAARALADDFPQAMAVAPL